MNYKYIFSDTHIYFLFLLNLIKIIFVLILRQQIHSKIIIIWI